VQLLMDKTAGSSKHPYLAAILKLRIATLVAPLGFGLRLKLFETAKWVLL